MSALPPWVDRQAYPFTPKRFRSDDGELSYLDEGAGPAVVFVHGSPSWSFEFREVVRELARDHRCVAVDHLGFGLSEKPVRAPLAPEDHARRLRTLVLALGVRDATLVVHDFGGPIGLPLALERDGVVRSVVVLNSWMWPSEGDPVIARVDRLARSWLGRVLYRWFGFAARVVLPLAFGDRRKLTRGVHRQYLAPLATHDDREGTYALALALRGADSSYASLWERRARLAELPITMVWGMKDPAIRPAHLDRWVRAFPHADVVRLHDVGHFVAEEHPGAVVDAVRALELGRAPRW